MKENYRGYRIAVETTELRSLSFGYQDNFGGSDANQGTHIIGDFTINLDWSGFSPTDTLEFSLPSNGVMISEVAIPEPASLWLLSLGTLGLLSRTRRNK